MARVTILETLYYQEPRDEPIDLSSMPCEIETKDEQPYIRKIIVGEEKKAIDFGWVEEPGMIKINNHSQVATIKLPELNMLIPPGCSTRFWMDVPNEVSLVATEENVKVTVTVLAK